MLKCALLLVVGAACLVGQIDPSIPLRVNTPKPPDLIQQMIEIQRLRNLQIQQRMQEEELRRVQLENKARKSSPGDHSVPSAPPSDVRSAALPSPPNVTPVDLGLQTQGLYNGRAWKQFSEDSKIAFVLGFSYGAGITNPPDFRMFVPATLSNREIADGLDRFYLEPENLAIPMGIAVAILAKKTSGAEQTDIDALLAGARRWALQSSIPAPTK